MGRRSTTRPVRPLCTGSASERRGRKKVANTVRRLLAFGGEQKRVSEFIGPRVRGAKRRQCTQSQGGVGRSEGFRWSPPTCLSFISFPQRWLFIRIQYY